MDLSFHISPWEIWGIVVLVWGLVACTWHKRQVTLKVVQGKVGVSGRDAGKKKLSVEQPRSLASPGRGPREEEAGPQGVAIGSAEELHVGGEEEEI